MLNNLRKKLTLICVITTGILLSLMAAGLLLLSENQMEKQSNLTFQNNINSIIYKIQSSRVIDTAWISQQEAGNNLILHVEDNGKPILYQGSWIPETDRDTLIRTAQETALRDYRFDAAIKPLSVITVDSVTFPLEGAHGDHYQAAVIKIPSYENNWQSITLLRDISSDRTQKLVMRLSFLGLILLTLFILFIFSWWFAGRAISPIEQSRKKQTEFVAAASHELRSPLAVIQASLSALAFSQNNDPEKSARFIHTAEGECRRMAGLIDDLLFLASTDAGRWPMRTQPVEADTLMIELYESFEPLARKNGQTLRIFLPDQALPFIAGDRQRLFQALSVLVSNAMSYIPSQGIITLDAELQKHALILSVADNGPGIADEEKEAVFERFYRSDLSRSKKEHYGLGLSVAREIAELHGGSLTLSDAPGGGALFQLSIPLK